MAIEKTSPDYRPTLHNLKENTFCSELLGKCHYYKSPDSFFFLQPVTGATFLAGIELGRHIIGGGNEPKLLQALHSRGFAISGLSSKVNNPKIVDPRFFMVDLTKSCSNHCLYCFRKLKQTAFIENEILDKIIAKIIEHCKENHLEKIALQAWGGEPLLAWESICRMQDVLNNAGIDVRLLIETNGVSVTQDIAKEMYSRNILCSVSIDGPAHIHNRNRLLRNGRGSYKECIRGFNILRDAGYGNKIGVVCVITRNSLNSLTEIVDFFAKELELSRVKMNIVKDSDQMIDKTLGLKGEEVSLFWSSLINELITLNKNGISFGESTIIAMLHNLTTQRPMSLCHSRGCQSGYRMLSFGMDGGIYPCDLTDYPELLLDNINSQDGLGQIISRQTSSHSFLKLQLPAQCHDCNWQSFCGGGCSAMRLHNDNNDFEQSDCSRNHIVYPTLINLIINEPNIIESLSCGEIKIT